MCLGPGLLLLPTPHRKMNSLPARTRATTTVVPCARRINHVAVTLVPVAAPSTACREDVSSERGQSLHSFSDCCVGKGCCWAAATNAVANAAAAGNAAANEAANAAADAPAIAAAIAAAKAAAIAAANAAKASGANAAERGDGGGGLGDVPPLSQDLAVSAAAARLRGPAAARAAAGGHSKSLPPRLALSPPQRASRRWRGSAGSCCSAPLGGRPTRSPQKRR